MAANDAVDQVTAPLPITGLGSLNPQANQTDPDQQKAAQDLISGMQNYAPDYGPAKWMAFAANIAKPTKFGSLGEVVSNVSSGLQPVVNEEQKLKNQYKMMALQQQYQYQMKDKIGAQTSQMGLAEKAIQLRQMLLTNQITQVFYNKALEGLAMSQPASSTPQGATPVQAQPATTTSTLPVQGTTPYQGGTMTEDQFNSLPQVQGGSAPIGGQPAQQPSTAPSQTPVLQDPNANPLSRLSPMGMLGAAMAGPQEAGKALLQLATRPATRLGDNAFEKNGQIVGMPSAAPPGYYWTFDSNNKPTLTKSNDAPAIAAQQAGAMESAKQGEEYKPFQTGNGTTIYVKAKDFAHVSGLLPQTSPQPVAQSTTTSTARPTAPAQPMANIAGFSKTDIFNKVKEQVDAAVASGDPAQVFKAIATKNSVLSNLQGQTPQDYIGNDAWSKPLPQMPPAPAGQQTFYTEMMKNKANSQSKLNEELGAQASAANDRLAANGQALHLLGSSNIGPGASWTADMQNIASKYLPGAITQYFDVNGSPTTALEKTLVNAATAKAKQQFGSRITQSEVNLMLTRGSPNVGMPEAAVKYLLTTDNVASQYAVQKAQDFSRYIQAGGDPEAFQGWHARNFPLTEKMSQVASPGTATNGWSIKRN